MENRFKYLLQKEVINEMFIERQEALRLFYQHLPYQNRSEIQKKLNHHLEELEKDASLNLLAFIEASFRLDYQIRCKKRLKDEISQKLRTYHKVYESKLPLEILFDEWKKSLNIPPNIISSLKGAFKYRHWLAHGRYWKYKGEQYDFYKLYDIASAFEDVLLII